MGEARQVVDRFYSCFAAGDWDGARTCYADDCVTVMPGGMELDNDGHMQMGRAFKAALPDGHMEVVRAVENGNEVFVGGTFAGTHTGDMVTPQGTMPASGGKLALPYADYFRVEGGKIVEHNVVFDQLTFASQLGAGPG
jgi:predicted ester cyclase